MNGSRVRYSEEAETPEPDGSQDTQKATAVKKKATSTASKPSHAKVPPYEHWKRRAFIAWALIGAGVIFVASLNVAGIIWQALAVVLIAGVITFLFHKPVEFLENKGLPRIIGTALCLLGFIAAATAALLICLPNIVSEIQNFTKALPGYASQLQEFADGLSTNGAWGVPAEQIQTAIDAGTKWLGEQASEILAGAASGIVGGIVDFGTGVVIFFIALLCSFWMLLDWPTISKELRKIIPESRHDDLDILKEAFGTALYGWLKATIICALLTGFACFIMFWMFGMPYSVVLALSCAILYVVPYIGIVLACVFSFVIGLLVSPGTAVAALIFVLVIMNVIANVVAPRLMENSLNLHPAVILVVIMAGGALMGVWGMLLSIPLTAALQAVFVAYFEARTGRALASADGALFSETIRLSSSESWTLDANEPEEDEGDED